MRVAKPCLRISSMRNRGRAGIPTLTMSSFMTARTTNCTKGRSSPGTRSVYISRAPFHEFVPNGRIGWWGLGTGMKAYHTFLLVKTDQDCHIITEEVVRGEGYQIPPGAAERNAWRPRSLAKGRQRAL